MNSDMRDDREPTLRQRQRDATRAAIVGAFLDLSHDGNTVAISMPQVAEAAGISVRTLYRYFATKDDLQTAAANYFHDRVNGRAATRRSEIDADNFDGYLLALWREFATETPAVVAEHATPAGRKLRAARLPDSRQTVRDALPGDAESTDDELVDLLVAMTSSSMYLELVERMGHTPERAVRMVGRAIRGLLAQRPASEGATP